MLKWKMGRGRGRDGKVYVLDYGKRRGGGSGKGNGGF